MNQPNFLGKLFRPITIVLEFPYSVKGFGGFGKFSEATL